MNRKPACIVYIVAGKEERYKCTERLLVSLNALTKDRNVNPLTALNVRNLTVDSL